MGWGAIVNILTWLIQTQQMLKKITSVPSLLGSAMWIIQNNTVCINCKWCLNIWVFNVIKRVFRCFKHEHKIISFLRHLKLRFSLLLILDSFLSCCCHFTRRWRSVLSGFSTMLPLCYVFLHSSLSLLPFYVSPLPYLSLLSFCFNFPILVRMINIVIRAKTAVHLKGNVLSRFHMSHI